ncbi:MAG: hypothetical protein LBQ15_11565 [Clostridium sp.]|nr:hypothetical protein [Clostridium sp.]
MRTQRSLRHGIRSGRFLDIRDNCPKYVLRTDKFEGGNHEGIKTMHIADFLLSDEFLCSAAFLRSCFIEVPSFQR